MDNRQLLDILYDVGVRQVPENPIDAKLMLKEYVDDYLNRGMNSDYTFDPNSPDMSQVTMITSTVLIFRLIDILDDEKDEDNEAIRIIAFLLDLHAYSFLHHLHNDKHDYDGMLKSEVDDRLKHGQYLPDFIAARSNNEGNRKCKVPGEKLIKEIRKRSQDYPRHSLTQVRADVGERHGIKESQVRKLTKNYNPNK
jgi:hypothetical protein